MDLISIWVLIGFTVTVCTGLAFARLRNKLTGMFCSIGCGITIYLLSKAILDQAIPSSVTFGLSWWISLAMGVAVAVIIAAILNKLVAKSDTK
jgi:hypothetical protein